MIIQNSSQQNSSISRIPFLSLALVVKGLIPFQCLTTWWLSKSISPCFPSAAHSVKLIRKPHSPSFWCKCKIHTTEVLSSAGKTSAPNYFSRQTSWTPKSAACAYYVKPLGGELGESALLCPESLIMWVTTLFPLTRIICGVIILNVKTKFWIRVLPQYTEWLQHFGIL